MEISKEFTALTDQEKESIEGGSAVAILVGVAIGLFIGSLIR